MKRSATARPIGMGFMSRQHGSAMVEYTVVLAFLVIVLIADDNVIKQLADAVRNVYASFVYALSVSWL